MLTLWSALVSFLSAAFPGVEVVRSYSIEPQLEAMLAGAAGQMIVVCPSEAKSGALEKPGGQTLTSRGSWRTVLNFEVTYLRKVDNPADINKLDLAAKEAGEIFPVFRSAVLQAIEANWIGTDSPRPYVRSLVGGVGVYCAPLIVSYRLDQVEAK